MKLPRLIFVFLILSGATIGGTASASEPTDAAAIRALQMQQADAWTRHDAIGYADTFTPDADFISVRGVWWHGRAEIASKLGPVFAGTFRHSKMTITDVQISMLNPMLALAHVRWNMTGLTTSSGGAAPPTQAIELQLLRKQRGKWLIASFQSTYTPSNNP